MEKFAKNFSSKIEICLKKENLKNESEEKLRKISQEGQFQTFRDSSRY